MAPHPTTSPLNHTPFLFRTQLTAHLNSFPYALQLTQINMWYACLRQLKPYSYVTINSVHIMHFVLYEKCFSFFLYHVHFVELRYSVWCVSCMWHHLRITCSQVCCML